MEDVILNAGGIIYYVGSWLIFIFAKVKGKSSASSMNFVTPNRVVAIDSTDPVSLPTHTIDSRGIHEGKIMGVNSKFFHFVRLVEVIHTSNFNGNDIAWHYESHIFE